MTAGRKPRLRTCENGATAVEFAIVSPIFIMLLLGIIYGCLLMYTMGSLHYAVQAAARCGAVMTATCGSAAATQTYALNHYYALNNPTPQFTASAAACGQQVTGSLTYILDVAFARWSIPLSATACFP